MKITICGSISIIDKMIEVKADLEKLGHEVDMPPLEITDAHGQPMDVREYYRLRHAENITDNWIWEQKKKSMLIHFDKIAWADAVLILNMDKNDTPGYIGANTFMEMGLALYLKKPIYLYNPAPEKISYREEILGCHPISLDRDLSKIPR